MFTHLDSPILKKEFRRTIKQKCSLYTEIIQDLTNNRFSK